MITFESRIRMIYLRQSPFIFYLAHLLVPVIEEDPICSYFSKIKKGQYYSSPFNYLYGSPTKKKKAQIFSAFYSPFKN